MSIQCKLILIDMYLMIVKDTPKENLTAEWNFNTSDCITPTTISAISLPVPSLPDTTVQLTDVNEPVSGFAGLKLMLSYLSSGIIIVPFVAILQSIGIGKSLAERGNYKG